MKRRGPEPVHALEIPTGAVALLVPSACIAEVINPGELAPLPCAPAWVTGVIGWRSRAVPLVSFERLLALPDSAPTARSKFIVFYPLPGCKPWEFFAIPSTAEPQTRILDGTDAPATSTELAGKRFIAMGLKLGREVLAIPDFAALKAALYP
ncbi:MAG: chemotaxis protein CheW [Gammaproteobacteria bacterium]|nr:chemotaxis protein CheW [Gammaproteobacteria bacterium]